MGRYNIHNTPSILQEGDIIADIYRIEKDLSKGKSGKGDVFKIRHRMWDIDLVMKTPQVYKWSTDEIGKFTREFEAEADKWIKLGLHPHIVCCYYVHVMNGIPRLFAEYVDGGSLFEWIVSGRLYTGSKQEILKRILEFTIQAATGLNYAHGRNLIHMDVKPENIMVSAKYRVKITDFGLSKFKDSQVYSGNEGESFLFPAVAGTKRYRSPEQASLEANRGEIFGLTANTDIWSLGLTLLAMFRGSVMKPEEDGVYAAEMLEAFLERMQCHPVLPAMPSGIIRVLKRCFEKDIRMRYLHIGDFINDLQEVYREKYNETYVLHLPNARHIQAASLNNMALSLWTIGKKDEAVEVFEKSVGMDPLCFDAEYNRALIAWKKGHINDIDAIRRMEALVRNFPNHAKPLKFLKMIHYLRKDTGMYQQIPDVTASSEDSIWNTSVEIAAAWKDWPGNAYEVFGIAVYVAVSSDGKRGLSGDYACKDLHYWDFEKRVCISRISGHAAPISSVAISGDGCRGLSGSFDHTVRFWDLAKRECIYVLNQHRSNIMSVMMTADSRRAVSADMDGIVCYWDLERGRCLKVFTGHKGYIVAVDISNDGTTAISGGEDKTLRVWSLSDKKLLKILMIGSTVTSAVLSEDGVYALTGSKDGIMRLWDISTGYCINQCKEPYGSIEGVDFAPHFEEDSGQEAGRLPQSIRFALTGNSAQILRLWDLETGVCIRTFREPYDMAVSADLSKPKSMGIREELIRLNNAVIAVEKGRTYSISVSVDGQSVLTGCRKKTMRLWSLGKVGPLQPIFSLVRMEEAENQLLKSEAVCRLEDEAREFLQKEMYSSAATAVQTIFKMTGFEHHPEALDIFNEIGRKGSKKAVKSFWLSRILEGHRGKIGSLAVSANQSHLLTGGLNGIIRLWDLASFRCVKTLQGTSADIVSLVISSDGTHAAAVGEHGHLNFWNLEKGQNIEKHTYGNIYAIVQNAIGSTVLTGSEEEPRNTGYLWYWDLKSGNMLKPFRFGTNHPSVDLSIIDHAVISPDGSTILTTHFNREIYCWSVADGKYTGILSGHEGQIKCLSYSPDGRYILSAGCDKTIRLWDTADPHMKCKSVLRGQDSTIMTAAFFPGGRFALSGGYDASLCIWDLEKEACISKIMLPSDIDKLFLPPDVEELEEDKLFKDTVFISPDGKSSYRKLWNDMRTEGFNAINALAVIHNGRYAVLGTGSGKIYIYEFVWDYDFTVN